MCSTIRKRYFAGALAAALFVAAIALTPLHALGQQADATQQASPRKTRVVGVIKAISGNTVTLTTDSGADISIAIQPTTLLKRLEPGQTDLKSATTIQLSDIQIGDRLLAGGTASEDGKSLAATSAVVMKKADVAEKQQHEREEWRRNGAGGSVKSADVASGTITLSTGALGTNTLTIHVAKSTVIRRYPADSWNYDDAKPATLDQIKAGDQLNARGTKSEDGKELTASEIVFGTFRSIAASVISADAANNTILVTDLANKRSVTLKVGPASQMRQLPAMFAQRIAMRLKSGAGGDSGSGAGGSAAPGRPQGGEARPAGGGGERGAGGGFGGGGQRAGGPPDFQQMLNRMPAVTLSQLQKGDALMIVATEGTPQSPSTVIVLLSGVEPILTAASPSAATTILSPWNLSTSANAGTGDTP